MSKLSKFPNLRSLRLCSYDANYLEVNVSFSIPPLHKLELGDIEISIFNIQHIFQAIASTLAHLKICDPIIKGSAKSLKLLFTALESCYIDLDEGDRNTDFYKILLEAISGSEKTLKVFRSPKRNLDSDHYFLCNAQVLEFNSFNEVEF
jgi:hypothetical protein